MRQGSRRTAEPVSSRDFRLEMIFGQPPDTASKHGFCTCDARSTTSPSVQSDAAVYASPRVCARATAGAGSVPDRPGCAGNSALSGSDRHDFAVSQGVDIANWGPAKESPVLAIELARALVADLERRTCRVQLIREHALLRSMQAKLLLKLQRTHRRKSAKMVVQRRSTHACNRCQVLYTQRLLVV